MHRVIQTAAEDAIRAKDRWLAGLADPMLSPEEQERRERDYHTKADWLVSAHKVHKDD